MRDLTTAFLNALSAEYIRPIVLYQGEFASGTVRLWSGIGDLPWNGHTWLGAGQLAGISAIEESTDVRANSVRLSLSGIPASTIALVLGDVQQGRPGILWFGLLDDNDQVIADPYLTYEGRLDVPEIDEDGETALVSIVYENALVDLERPREFRYTDEAQKAFYPDDRGFEYVESLQDWNGVWGRG